MTMAAAVRILAPLLHICMPFSHRRRSQIVPIVPAHKWFKTCVSGLEGLESTRRRSGETISATIFDCGAFPLRVNAPR
jgi:hypothetical protein